MKRINQDKKTRHHIIPTSRRKGKGILGVCKVPEKQHSLYHNLFGNQIPEEIVVFLNKTFWDNNYDITIYRKMVNRGLPD